MKVSEYMLETLRQDGEFILFRGRHLRHTAANPPTILVVTPVAERPALASLRRMEHEYSLRADLDPRWAVQPLALVSHQGRTMLVLADPRGEPLDRQLGRPLELTRFLHLAVALSAALRRLHGLSLVHKDIKPSHVLVRGASDQVWLTGFGIASRLPRERASPQPPELIAGTLPYMAPEQTGRMNRSIDSRSDLYSLGVTFYQLLTGALPFRATDPMEWVHCHVAKKPMPPGERSDGIPAAVSAIIMKLLAKTAEERYQTAAGVERDLRRCLADCEGHGRVDQFALGQHDIPDRLLIPEKLYGRAREVETLLAAFDRIVNGGEPELVLVSGYSGIGKSSVVNELHKVLVPPRGLFASGKFDQYKRDIPYSTLVQAFQSLVRPLLGKSDSELAIWRDAFLEALEPNARLMTDLIPELKLIIGDQPPIPELEPQQAQSRFQLVFRRFIGVFARPEHPLALFLDDLQWLDGATLDLVEDLLTRSTLPHLMLIGAYRDNEVDPAHPLTRKLDAIRQVGARVQEIRLAPLDRDDLGQLIADALRCDRAHVAPLAQLVHEKTAGNPFFVIQFVYTLAEEGLFRFDHDAACWSWDLDRIHTKGYTDNVVDLMVGKLTRLPAETQQALRQFACLGNLAATATLSKVLSGPEEQVHALLWPAVRHDLIERLDGHLRFIHDRVQEAAYSLIPEASRAEAHLRIGRLLVTQTPPENREQAIFEMVGQLNRGASLITQQEEKDELAALNLIAGKRAKASTAYASALTYLNAGAALLTDESWNRSHELIFATELNLAECEFLTGHVSAADGRLAALSKHTTNTVERAFVACLHIDVCTALDRAGDAVVVCLEYLRQVGIEWSPRPNEEEVRREYERIWSLLGNRTIEDLIDLPLMEDPASLATVDVLSKVLPPALFTDANLASLTICKAVSLSLERGNCPGSCFAYVMLGRIAGPRFGDYTAGFRFGQLGYELVERRGLRRFEASTYHCFAVFVVLWTKHVRACRDLLRRAFEAANRVGDLMFGAYACNNLNSDLLFAAEPLPEVQGEAEHGLAFAEKARFGLVIDVITTQLALIRTLRGFSPKFGCFDDGQFNELRTERHLTGNPVLAIAACWYWIRKLQARYTAGDYATAINAASKAQRLLWTSASFFEEAEYHFYSALSQAASCDSARADERQPHIDAVAAHHKQLKVWAENCPENFENRAALVGAEFARIECRDLDAMRLYEQAIHSARENGFVQNEAIAHERAADFYRARGFDRIADLYLRNARYAYVRWGADGKVRQLEEMFPHLRTEDPAPGPTSTIGAPVGLLDLATVINVSQAVSGEMVLGKLIDTLMRTAVAQAGAERGVLILSRGAEQRIEAEATTGGDAVFVRSCDTPVTAAVLPESVIHYVLHTQECMILDDAAVQEPFSTDRYVREQQARSILCLPMLNQAKLIGVLYLENNLAPRVFSPGRIAVLRLLASQAAISLDNTRLYRDLEEREAKIRRLVDANIIGIFFWDFDGRILEANDAFLRTVGYDRHDLAAGRIRWTDLTPDEWRERDARMVQEQTRTGRLQPFEKEYLRKDGSRVPVLLGAATFEEGGTQGVAFVLDLSERKRADEERIRMLRAEAANRAKDEFLANVSHEIRTPMNAILGMTELALETELTEDQRQCLRTVKSAADNLLRIINDLLDFSKIEAGKLLLDLADFSLRTVLGDTLYVLAMRAHKKGLELISHVQPDVPDALVGDSGRLRQILLNLVGNAIKFTNEGEVEVLVELAGQLAPNEARLRFTVRDTGIGIPLDKQESVFRAFEQEDTSTTRKYGGSGLGLTIASRLVALMGGQITVESEPGRGSTFAFTAHFGLQPHPPQQPAGRPPILLRDLPVLVVDDNATNRRILEEWLRGWQMKPVAVGDSVAALDALWDGVSAGRPYALMLLDARMRDTDGLELAAKIRKRAELSSIRIILLTSGDRPGDPARIRELQVNAHLLKPVQQDELLETIYEVMSQGDGSGSSATGPAGGWAQPLAPAPAARQLRILVAEDNEFNAQLLEQLLGRRGCRVRLADNGRTALALAREGGFDLLLLDVHMPELDGFQVAQALRERERTAGGHLPIIALTARSRKEDRERCLAAGMDDFLSKPIQAADLWAAIQRVVSAGPPDERTGSGLLNSQMLLANCEGDAATLEAICRRFRSCLPDDLTAIQEALRNQDAPRLREAAHKLSGMVAAFSTAAGSVAASLEDQAAQGKLQESRALVDQLETMVPQLMRLVDALSLDTLRDQAGVAAGPDRTPGR